MRSRSVSTKGSATTQSSEIGGQQTSIDLFHHLHELHKQFKNPDQHDVRRRKLEGTTVLTQNIRGFRKSERNKWLDVWRGEVGEKQRDVFLLQETHVATAAEVKELIAAWNRIWGAEDEEQATTFWCQLEARPPE